MSQSLPPIPCILEWGNINQVHDEGIYSENTVIKSLWKIVDVHGKASLIAYEDLIIRIREFSIESFEGIESPEKEVRASLIRSGRFSMRFFMAVEDNLEKAVEKVRTVLKRKNFYTEKQIPINEESCKYAGQTPIPRKSHTNALKAYAYEEIESVNGWTLERCFLQRVEE